MVSWIYRICCKLVLRIMMKRSRYYRRSNIYRLRLNEWVFLQFYNIFLLHCKFLGNLNLLSIIYRPFAKQSAQLLTADRSHLLQWAMRTDRFKLEFCLKFGGILFNDFFSDDLATLFFKKKTAKSIAK